MRSDKIARGSFLGHAAIYGFGTLLLQAASFVVLPLYTHYLTPEEFGVYDILARLAEVVSICMIANGIRLAAFTFYSQHKHQQSRDSTAASATIMLWCMLIGGFGMIGLFNQPIRTFLGIADARLFYLGVFTVMLDTTTCIPLALMQARTESKAFVLLSCAMFVVRTTLISLSVVVLKWGLWGVLASTAVTSITFAIPLTIRELYRGSFIPSPKEMKGLFIFALPFLPAGLLQFIVHCADRFFLMHYTGANDTGVYALGVKLATAVGIVTTTPLTMVWCSRMYQAAERPDAPKVFGDMYARITLAYVFVGLGVAIFAPEIVFLFGTEAYRGVVPVLVPLLFAYLLLRTAGLMDASFYVQRQTAIKPVLMGIGAAVALTGQAWAVPRFGIYGAAWSTAIAYGVLCGATLFTAQRVFYVQYNPRTWVVAGIVTAGSFLAALPLDLSAMSFGLKCLIWGAWPMVIWATDALPVGDKEIIGSTARRIVTVGNRLLRSAP